MSQSEALTPDGSLPGTLSRLLIRGLTGAIVVWLLTAATAAQSGATYPLVGPAGAPASHLPGVETCLGCFRAADPMLCHRVAVDLAMHRDYTRAIAIEEMVHARVPGDPEVSAALARMYQDGTRNIARATELYRTALAVRPGYPPALAGLGRLMQDKGENDIAIGYFKRLVRENPEEPHFKMTLADALVRGGRESEAGPLLTEIVQRWPGTPEATSARSLMTRSALAKP